TPAAHVAPLHPAAAPTGDDRPHLSLDGERRQVTVLVSLLAGYAELIERCPPDEVEWVTNRVRNAAVDVIRRHGGHIEELHDDGLRVLFGIPEMHEDDAVRAVRAALALHQKVRALAGSTTDGPGRTIRMQIGRASCREREWTSGGAAA